MSATAVRARHLANRHLWILPVAALLAAWVVVPAVSEVPDYKLPRLSSVAVTGWQLLVDGTLVEAAAASLGRLLLAFTIGAGLGLVVGLGMATSAALTWLIEPVVRFFQAVAGIAWIPLAIVWFGFGTGPVLFVVANAIFFIVLANTILGVQAIPPVLTDAARTLGAGRLRLLAEVTVPGAMVSVLTGLRIGLAFGWRALIAVELIAANAGLGYLTLSASRNYQADVVVVCIITVGVLWVAMDRLVLDPVERRTVVRWGLVTGERPQ